MAGTSTTMSIEPDGNDSNIEKAQKELLKRSKLNSDATQQNILLKENSL